MNNIAKKFYLAAGAVLSSPLVMMAQSGSFGEADTQLNQINTRFAQIAKTFCTTVQIACAVVFIYEVVDNVIKSNKQEGRSGDQLLKMFGSILAVLLIFTAVKLLWLNNV